MATSPAQISENAERVEHCVDVGEHTEVEICHMTLEMAMARWTQVASRALRLMTTNVPSRNVATAKTTVPSMQSANGGTPATSP
jgi:hypothetical protein